MSINLFFLGRRFWKTALVAFFAMAGASVQAQTVTPRSDPGDEKGQYVTYVGHYGEVLKIRMEGWKIRPSMHGEAEVVDHYPGFRLIPGDLTEPFNPKPEDFVPENFSRDELVQLIVLPWSASSSKSLEALKPQKIADLKASGVEFRIIDDPWVGYGHADQKWPKGSFEVFIASPYLLSQLYTSSGKHLVIMTAGRDKPPSTFISKHSDQLRMSLREWIVPTTGNEVPKTYGPVPAREVPPEGISLRVFTNPRVWMTWALATAAACLLLGILGVAKRWDPLRRASLSLLIFSNAGAVIGGLVGLCFWPFPWSSQHLTVPSAVACLFMPLLAWIMGRVRGRRPRRRAVVGAAAWALIFAVFLGYAGLAWNWGTEWLADVPANTAYNAFMVYAIGGIIFGFLDSAASMTGGRRILSTLLLLLAASGAARAQPVPIEKSMPNPIGKSTPSPTEPEAVTRAKQELAKHGLDRDSFIDPAKKTLGKTEVLYDYQRVEIKGILAKDGTHKVLHNLFDMEIAPSHIGDKGNTVIAAPSWVKEAFNGAKDFKDLHADAYGAFTETAMQAVKELQDKEVNGIVAHSWGTEIVYNAILAGKINPPRQLIVCGMPDRDMEKWVALSKYTGTEVVVYANSHDPAARAARIVGGIIESGGESPAEKIERQRIEKKLGVDTTTNGFEETWAAACLLRPCNPHARQPVAPKFDYKYKGPTHSRFGYFDAMLKDGTIPFGESDAYALRDRQAARITAEADKMYSAAVAREVANANPEGVKTESDLGFLQAWERGTAPLSDQARAAKTIQDAERLERERLEREEQERQARQVEEDARAALELAAGPKKTSVDDMNAAAASCGYKIDYDADGAMLGFGGFILGRHQVPFDFGDLKVIFLATRACRAIENNPEKPVPPACNGAASLLKERVGRGDFTPKVEYLTQGTVWGYLDRSRCLQTVLANANKITDTKSFNNFMASYQKTVVKHLAEEAKDRRASAEREERDKERARREANGPPPSRQAPPPADHDEVWKRINPIIR